MRLKIKINPDYETDLCGLCSATGDRVCASYLVSELGYTYAVCDCHLDSLAEAASDADRALLLCALDRKAS